jgi:hypothetical protein
MTHHDFGKSIGTRWTSVQSRPARTQPTKLSASMDEKADPTHVSGVVTIQKPSSPSTSTHINNAPTAFCSLFRFNGPCPCNNAHRVTPLLKGSWLSSGPIVTSWARGLSLATCVRGSCGRHPPFFEHASRLSRSWCSASWPVSMSVSDMCKKTKRERA